MNKYQVWIEEYISRKNGNIAGQCRNAVKEMCNVFPELTAVSGHVSTDHYEPRAHWWCIDSDGNIVDPTESQFRAVFGYIPWKPGDEIKVGRCMYCGESIWRSVQSLDSPGPKPYTCSTECGKKLLEDTDCGLQ